jgi:threonine/homoserine/homoserine lactone efflux protein
VDLAAFLGVAALAIVTPGPDTALTIRTTLAGGRRAGIATAAGVTLGQIGWTLAASAGLAALLVTSEPVFTVWKTAGAAYLVYLGVVSLWGALARHRVPATRGVHRGATTPRAALRRGAISNLGNPKMAVFFTSLLPQFVTTETATFAALAALGLAFAAMTAVWLTLYAVAVSRAGDLLRAGSLRRALDALAGCVLIAFGVKLLRSDRF